MSVPELYEIFYAQLDLMDRTYEFWLSATFAVVVASHFMAGSLSRRLAAFIALVYSLFSFAVALRWMSATRRFGVVRQQLISSGEVHDLESGTIVGILLALTFAAGFVGTLAFIWSSYQKSK